MKLVNAMVAPNVQASGIIVQFEIVVDQQCSFVEENVMVGAKAQKILKLIGAIVGPAQRPYVGCLSVGSALALNRVPHTWQR